MATKPNRPQVDRARPVVRTPAKTDTNRVTLTRTLSGTMQASPNWGQAADVHPALARVSKDAGDIDANAKVIEELKSKLRDAVGKQRTLRRDWGVSMRSLQSTVELYAAGSVDVVKGFGFEVVSHTQSAPFAAPADLLVKTGKDVGQVIASWKRGQARKGFVVQHATDPSNPATYSATQPSTKAKCTLGGLPPGTIVHVRVAAVDPAAPLTMSPWSEWRSGTVR